MLILKASMSFHQLLLYLTVFSSCHSVSVGQAGVGPGEVMADKMSGADKVYGADKVSGRPSLTGLP